MSNRKTSPGRARRQHARVNRRPAFRPTELRRADITALLRALPERVDADDLFARLYLQLKITAAEAAVAAGRVVPHAEVVRRVHAWLK